MLALAMRATARRLLRPVRWAKSNFRPIWNISRMSPIYDSICIDAAGVE